MYDLKTLNKLRRSHKVENIITVISKYSLKQCFNYANVLTKNTRNQHYQYLNQKQKNGADNYLFPLTENIPTEFQILKNAFFSKKCSEPFLKLFFFHCERATTGKPRMA